MFCILVNLAENHEILYVACVVASVINMLPEHLIASSAEKSAQVVRYIYALVNNIYTYELV